MSISNTFFTQTYSTKVNIVSSIAQLNITPASTQVFVNTLQTFQISYASLGEPSCASIDYTINGVKYYQTTVGTDVTTCAKYFPTINAYNGTYYTSGGVWSFQITMNKIGYATLNINVANYFTTAYTLSTSLNVVKSLTQCNEASLGIVNGAMLFYAPVLYQRNELITIVSVTNISCLVSLYNTKAWTVYKIDPTTGLSTTTVALTGNPTVNYAELVIPPNLLDYGTYKLVYQLTMLDTNNAVFSNQAYTFIKIVQSGLVISAVNLNQLNAGGTVELNRGTNQMIEFNPALNSYDIDGMVLMTSMTYSFYCQVIDAGVQMGYPQAYANAKLDLYTYKLKSTVNINTNQTCFNSTGL